MTTTYPRWPVVGIFIILAIHLMSWAGGFLIPITAAMLGFLVVLPIESRLSRWGVPSPVTAMAFTLGLAVLIGFVILSLSGPVSSLIEQLPRMVQRLRYDLSGMGGGTLDNIKEAAQAAQEVVGGGAEEAEVSVRVTQDTGVLARLIATAPALGGQLILTLVLMFFLIASGSSFLRKLVMVMPSFEDKRRAVEIVRTVTAKLGTYLGGITIINAGLGISIGLAMWALGVPNPLMFAFIGFAFNFIPYLGGIAGASLATLVAYAEYGDMWGALAVLGTYMLLTSIEGQFVTPYLISGRLKLNPTVVFVTVAFFAWIWSVIGMVVAVPILIAVKIILDQSDSTRAIGLFLGGDDQDPRSEE